MIVSPVWLPVTNVLAGSSGDASGGVVDIDPGELQGGAYGIGP
jgi:hypothetical protein